MVDNSKLYIDDREKLIEMLSSDVYYLRYASSELLNDKEVVLTAISYFGEDDYYVLKYVSSQLLNDKEVMLAAVYNGRGRYNYSLFYASDELKNDKELVLAAVSRDGCVLEYASSELRNDKEVALAAIFEDVIALKFVGEELKKDKLFLNEVKKYLRFEESESIFVNYLDDNEQYSIVRSR